MKGPIIVRVQTNYHEAQWLLETGTPVEIDTRYAQRHIRYLYITPQSS